MLSSSLLSLFTLLFTSHCSSLTSLDLLFTNGQVLDPQTKLDAILNVGIKDDKIVYIDTSYPNNLTISSEIDITGLTLTPGFIDIHSHGQTYESNRFQALDGVTTALELEFGSYRVKQWYESRIGNSLLNFGSSVGHIPIRYHFCLDSIVLPIILPKIW